MTMARSLIQTITTIFNKSSIHLFIHSVIYLFIYLFIHSLINLFIHSFIYSFIHPLDAHFTLRVPGTDPQQSQVYLCVADGVGSWRQYGVDPRQFSHR